MNTNTETPSPAAMEAATEWYKSITLHGSIQLAEIIDRHVAAERAESAKRIAELENELKASRYWQNRHLAKQEQYARSIGGITAELSDEHAKREAAESKLANAVEMIRAVRNEGDSYSWTWVASGIDKYLTSLEPTPPASVKAEEPQSETAHERSIRERFQEHTKDGVRKCLPITSLTVMDLSNKLDVADAWIADLRRQLAEREAELKRMKDSILEVLEANG